MYIEMPPNLGAFSWKFVLFFFLFVVVVVVVVVFSLIVTHFICSITMIDSYHGALYLIFECLCVRVRERERQKEREREKD